MLARGMTGALFVVFAAAVVSADYVNDRVHTTYSIASSVVHVHVDADVTALGDGGAPYKFQLPAAWAGAISPVVARDQSGAGLLVRQAKASSS